jgi:hypothetical protein
MHFIYIAVACLVTARAFKSKSHEGPVVRSIDGEIEEHFILELPDDDPSDGYIYL